MGYTHYWRRPKEIAPAAFSKIVADFNNVVPYLAEAGVRLAGGEGEGKPKVNDDEVCFNGLEKCGHLHRDLGITWPAKDAQGVSPPNPKAPLAQVAGEWSGGALLGSRTCGGDCSHETLYFPRVLKPSDWQKPENGRYFDFCKTAYKPYDLAVTAFLVIARHHLREKLLVSSDSDGLEQWRDAIRLCEAVLGYGEEFRLKEDEMPSSLRCPLCGRRHEGVEAFAHLLVAHGPLKQQKRPRTRLRNALPKIHRKLEEAGFDEVQAHLIVGLVAEELRKAGAI